MEAASEPALLQPSHKQVTLPPSRPRACGGSAFPKGEVPRARGGSTAGSHSVAAARGAAARHLRAPVHSSRAHRSAEDRRHQRMQLRGRVSPMSSCCIREARVSGGGMAERLGAVVGCDGHSADGGECPRRTQVVLGTVPRYVQAGESSGEGRSTLQMVGAWGRDESGVGDGE
jgi:hypothetical protein